MLGDAQAVRACCTISKLRVLFDVADDISAIGCQLHAQAQLLLSCSGAAFAANGGNKTSREGLYGTPCLSRMLFRRFLRSQTTLHMSTYGVHAVAVHTSCTKCSSQSHAGSSVKEEGRLWQDNFSKSGWLQAGMQECSDHTVNATVPAGSPTSVSGGKKLTAKPSSYTTPAKRAIKSPPVQQDIHPVFKLGYHVMCEVHCNGLQGLFLGGHDRDLYIQCTSHEYADLPLVDANQGGCIMSCSHFERAAGRELSKKWKESIHVVGEGEGSKATLLAWLKRQADAMSPDIVGSSVWVCWCNEADFYQGTVISFNRESGKHKVCHLEAQNDILLFWLTGPATLKPCCPVYFFGKEHRVLASISTSYLICLFQLHTLSRRCWMQQHCAVPVCSKPGCSVCGQFLLTLEPPGAAASSIFC